MDVAWPQPVKSRRWVANQTPEFEKEVEFNKRGRRLPPPETRSNEPHFYSSDGAYSSSTTQPPLATSLAALADRSNHAMAMQSQLLLLGAGAAAEAKVRNRELTERNAELVAKQQKLESENRAIFKLKTKIVLSQENARLTSFVHEAAELRQRSGVLERELATLKAEKAARGEAELRNRELSQRVSELSAEVAQLKASNSTLSTKLAAETKANKLESQHASNEARAHAAAEAEKAAAVARAERVKEVAALTARLESANAAKEAAVQAARAELQGKLAAAEKEVADSLTSLQLQQRQQSDAQEQSDVANLAEKRRIEAEHAAAIEAAKRQAAEEKEAALASAASERAASSELRGALEAQRDRVAAAEAEVKTLEVQVAAAEEARERNGELAEENRRLRAALYDAEDRADGYSGGGGGGGGGGEAYRRECEPTPSVGATEDRAAPTSGEAAPALRRPPTPLVAVTKLQPTAAGAGARRPLRRTEPAPIVAGRRARPLRPQHFATRPLRKMRLVVTYPLALWEWRLVGCQHTPVPWRRLHGTVALRAFLLLHHLLVWGVVEARAHALWLAAAGGAAAGGAAHGARVGDGAADEDGRRCDPSGDGGADV